MRKYGEVKVFLAVGMAVCLCLTGIWMTPTAAFSEEKPPSAFCAASVREKVVALTFDDGPDTQHTQAILDFLLEEEIHATFFVIGKNAENYPDLVRREQAEGHEIGIHTYTHCTLSEKSPEEIRWELIKTAEILSELLPTAPTLFRPPCGVYTDSVSSIADELSYKLVLWSVDPRDWSDTTGDEITKIVLEKTVPGSVILLHDYKAGDSNTLWALKRIIPTLKAEGYRFVTVSELMKMQETKET